MGEFEGRCDKGGAIHTVSSPWGQRLGSEDHGPKNPNYFAEANKESSSACRSRLPKA